MTMVERCNLVECNWNTGFGLCILEGIELDEDGMCMQFNENENTNQTTN